jgi:hypothetical protein
MDKKEKSEKLLNIIKDYKNCSNKDLVLQSFENKKFNIETIECKRCINSKNPGAKTMEVLISFIN